MSLEKFLASVWKSDERLNTENAGIIQRYLQEANVPITFTNFRGFFQGIPAFCNHNGVFLNNMLFNAIGNQVPPLFGIYVVIHEIQHYIQFRENPEGFYAGQDGDFGQFQQTVEEREADAETRTNNVLRELNFKVSTMEDKHRNQVYPKPPVQIKDFTGLSDIGISPEQLQQGQEKVFPIMQKIQELYKSDKVKYKNFGDAQYDVVVNGKNLSGLEEIRNFVRRALK